MPLVIGAPLKGSKVFGRSETGRVGRLHCLAWGSMPEGRVSFSLIYKIFDIRCAPQICHIDPGNETMTHGTNCVTNSVVHDVGVTTMPVTWAELCPMQKSGGVPRRAITQWMVRKLLHGAANICS